MYSSALLRGLFHHYLHAMHAVRHIKRHYVQSVGQRNALCGAVCGRAVNCSSRSVADAYSASIALYDDVSVLSPNGCFAAAGAFYAGYARYGHEIRYSGREIAAVIVALHLINVRSVGYVGESLLVLCGVSRRLSVALHEEASRVEEVCRCVELERGRLCIVYAAVSSRHA